MNDDKLKRVWRAATAPSNNAPAPDALPIIDADALTDLAQGSISAERRDASLAAAAESALNADLLATLRAISADADILSSGVQAIRQPAPVVGARPQSRQHRWLALAAGVAAVAITVSAVRQATPDPVSPTPPAVSSVVLPVDDGQIMTASFDEPASADARQEIFLGGFDS